MSDATRPEEREGYEKTAFTADRIPRQAPPPPKGKLGKLGDAFDMARLPWGHYIGVNPSQFEYEYSESWYMPYEYMGDKDFHDYNMINEIRWSKFVDENISLIYRFFRFWFVFWTHLLSFVGGAGYFVLGVAVFTSVMAAFMQFFSDSPEYPLLLLVMPLSVFAFCGICTLLRRLYETQSIRFYKSNKNWSDDVAFCRRSGLVKSELSSNLVDGGQAAFLSD